MIAALLMLAQVTPAAAEPNPVASTIAAIRANPKKFDGQLVRLHGWVNSCASATCLIEERPANSSGGPGESLSIGKDQKFDDVVRPLLPTYVEFDARVDAACLLAPCLDRASVLTIVTLRAVVSPEPPEIEN